MDNNHAQKRTLTESEETDNKEENNPQDHKNAIIPRNAKKRKSNEKQMEAVNSKHGASSTTILENKDNVSLGMPRKFIRAQIAHPTGRGTMAISTNERRCCIFPAFLHLLCTFAHSPFLADSLFGFSELLR